MKLALSTPKLDGFRLDALPRDIYPKIDHDYVLVTGDEEIRLFLTRDELVGIAVLALHAEPAVADAFLRHEKELR